MMLLNLPLFVADKVQRNDENCLVKNTYVLLRHARCTKVNVSVGYCLVKEKKALTHIRFICACSCLMVVCNDDDYDDYDDDCDYDADGER